MATLPLNNCVVVNVPVEVMFEIVVDGIIIGVDPLSATNPEVVNPLSATVDGIVVVNRLFVDVVATNDEGESVEGAIGTIPVLCAGSGIV